MSGYIEIAKFMITSINDKKTSIGISPDEFDDVFAILPGYKLKVSINGRIEINDGYNYRVIWEPNNRGRKFSKIIGYDSFNMQDAFDDFLEVLSEEYEVVLDKYPKKLPEAVPAYKKLLVACLSKI